jgi:hypothetical protein
MNYEAPGAFLSVPEVLHTTGPSLLRAVGGGQQRSRPPRPPQRGASASYSRVRYSGAVNELDGGWKLQHRKFVRRHDEWSADRVVLAIKNHGRILGRTRDIIVRPLGCGCGVAGHELAVINVGDGIDIGEDRTPTLQQARSL